MESEDKKEETKRVEISWENGLVRVKSLEGDVGVKTAVKLSSAVADWLEYDEKEGLKVVHSQNE